MRRQKGRGSGSATQRFVEALEVRRLLAAVLVKDINSQSADAANLSPSVEVNGTLYFTWLRSDIGLELWKSDGTADGTVLVKDINPGTAHGYIGPSVAYHGQDFFVAQTATTGRELWKSDGTEAGTQLVKELVPGTADLVLRGFFVVNDRLLFAAIGANTGLEWFITDGTAAGTHILKDINPGIGYGIFSENLPAPSGAPLAWLSDGEIYFSGYDGAGGYKLWKTDGTEAGTVIANPSGPTLGSTYPWQASFNGAQYYTASGQLWRIDPSGATIPITTGANQTLRVSRPVAAGGYLYFIGTGTDNVARLYQTQGQPDSTVLTPKAPVSPTSMTSAAGQLFFVASDAEHGSELWVTDGTNTHVIDINPGTVGSSPANVFEFRGTLYFSATNGISGGELWRSDGTNTTMVKDINAGPSSALGISQTFRRGTRIWFAANDGIHGNELWSSDGTFGGTTFVKDLDPTNLNSNPSLSNPLGCCQDDGHTHQVGFFNANTNGASGFWRTDGTSQGTFRLTGLESYALTTAQYVVPFGNRVMFAGSDATHGMQLWTSDGTQAGTRLVKNIGPNAFPDSLTEINGRLVFSASTPETGRELWISDGTEAGTHLAVDLTPGSGQGLDGFAEFIQFAGAVYFDGWLNGQHGLLRTGGTPETTEMVIELTGGQNRVYFRNLTVVGDQLYFTVDGTLYKTDGTDYTLIKAISPYYYGMNYQVVLGNTLLFINDDGNGNKLWRSDGTAAGTYPISPGQSNQYGQIRIFGGSAYVAGAKPNVVLWKTDGSSAGTVQVKSFPTTSNTGDLVSSHGRLYFPVANQLWQSDGTEASTIMVTQFRAPTAPGQSLSALDVNGMLLFNGWEPQTGVELWKIAPPTANGGAEYALSAGSTIQLNGAASSDPDPAENLQYLWDLDGDGIFGETGAAASRGDETGSTPNFSSLDLLPGTFAVALRVVDSIGLDSMASAQITITPPAFMNLSANAQISWSGTPGSRILNIHGGTLTLTGDLSSVYPGVALVADGNATVSLPAVQHLKDLTLLDSAKINLQNALFVSASQPQQTLAKIRGLIKSGKLFSSAVQADSHLAIGYVFDAASNSVKAMPTLLGDLNLDSNVSISDFIDLGSHFGQFDLNWSDGDVNYDDQVSIADFITLASNFGQTYPSAVPQAAAATVVTSQQKNRHRSKREHIHHRRSVFNLRHWSATSRQWVVR
jgi:ELWxxDGT repeat protein